MALTEFGQQSIHTRTAMLGSVRKPGIFMERKALYVGNCCEGYLKFTYVYYVNLPGRAGRGRWAAGVACVAEGH